MLGVPEGDGSFQLHLKEAKNLALGFQTFMLRKESKGEGGGREENGKSVGGREERGR